MNPTASKLLALDTSTEACSVALWLSGELTERYEIAPREHARLVLGMIEALLGEAGVTLRQLDAIAFGRGPGAFTGVRIATGVVQGLAFGADLPVLPVSSLAALAQQAMDREHCTRVAAAIDARMGEVYWGVYQRDATGFAQPLGEEEVGKAASVQQPRGTDWCGIGSGWKVYGEELAARLPGRLTGVFEERYPSAREVAKLGTRDFTLGHAVAAEEALPVYLRNNVVRT